VRVVVTPPSFSLKPKSHYEFGENLEIIDFPNASKISVSRFVILRGIAIKLERALKSFMLDIHRKKFGYEEMSIP
jgi:seryl-tRNA synthetase